MNEQLCDQCQRQKWDGGHALNEKECSEPNGEVCRLWQVLKRQTEALLGIRDQIEQYMAGNITNMELSFGMRDRVRRALDESLPAGTVFVQSWCGGEDSDYAKCVQDRDRLLKERDELAVALAAKNEGWLPPEQVKALQDALRAAEMCLPSDAGLSEYLEHMHPASTTTDLANAEEGVELQDALGGVREALMDALKIVPLSETQRFAKALVAEAKTRAVKKLAEGKEVIHLLRAGFPLCQFSAEVPRGWPAGNKWASSLAELKTLPPHQVPCGECVRVEERSKQRPR